MNLKEYSYLWNEQKEDYILVNTDLGYAIFNRIDKSKLLIEDDLLNNTVVNKMLEEGSNIYNNILDAYADI